MFAEEKYFNQDKNYLLKTVQAFSKDFLLQLWLQETLHAYHIQHNPMGLEDDFTIELKENITTSQVIIEEAYDLLAAIYRLDYGDNQLSFQWDGRTHMEVYDAEWKEMYKKWIKELSLIKGIQRPILRYAISKGQVNSYFLTQSIRKEISTFFNVRLRYKTLRRLTA